METPKNGRIKVCPNDPGHMTNMARTPIYGKTTLKSSSPEPYCQWPWGLVCSIGDVWPTEFVQMMVIGLP